MPSRGKGLPPLPRAAKKTPKSTAVQTYENLRKESSNARKTSGGAPVRQASGGERLVAQPQPRHVSTSSNALRVSTSAAAAGTQNLDSLAVCSAPASTSTFASRADAIPSNSNVQGGTDNQYHTPLVSQQPHQPAGNQYGEGLTAMDVLARAAESSQRDVTTPVNASSIPAEGVTSPRERFNHRARMDDAVRRGFEEHEADVASEALQAQHEARARTDTPTNAYAHLTLPLPYSSLSRPRSAGAYFQGLQGIPRNVSDQQSQSGQARAAENTAAVRAAGLSLGQQGQQQHAVEGIQKQEKDKATDRDQDQEMKMEEGEIKEAAREEDVEMTDEQGRDPRANAAVTFRRVSAEWRDGLKSIGE